MNNTFQKIKQTVEKTKDALTENQENLDSKNYFERVNANFNREILKGNINKETIDKIAEQNRESFFEKVVDAIKNPKEAYKWIKNSLMIKLADSWLGEKLGFKEKIDQIRQTKEKILGIVKNPVDFLQEKIKKLKVLEGSAVLGAVAGSEKLLNYFKQNPDEAKDIPTNPTELKKWWKEKIAKAGVSSEEREKLLTTLTEKENTHEYSEVWGEMIPLSEAMTDVKNETKRISNRVIQWCNDNPGLVITAGVISLSVGEIRNTLISCADNTKDTLIALAKIPFKSKLGAGISLGAVLSLSALLLESDNIMVPKDTEHFRKFVGGKVQENTEWFTKQGFELLSSAQTEVAADYICGKRKISELVGNIGEMLSGVAEKTLELATLTPEKLVAAKNDMGIDSFYHEVYDLAIGHEAEYAELLSAIKELKTNSKNHTKIDEKTFEKVRNLAQEFNIRFTEEDGLLKYSHLNENGVIVNGPRNLCVSPKLSEKEAPAVAKRFVTSTEDRFATQGANIVLDQLRLMSGNLFENVRDPEDASHIIETKLKDGWSLALVGTEVILTGVGQKFFLGPIHLVEHIIAKVNGNFSAVEAAVDYAEGIVPVFVISALNSAVRRDFKDIVNGKVLVKSAAYPLTGLYSLVKGGFKGGVYVGRHMLSGDFKGIYNNPKNVITASFNEKISSLKERYRSLPILKNTEIRKRHSINTKLSKVDGLISEYKMTGKMNKDIIHEAYEIIENTDELTKKNIFGEMPGKEDDFRNIIDETPDINKKIAVEKARNEAEIESIKKNAVGETKNKAPEKNETPAKKLEAPAEIEKAIKEVQQLDMDILARKKSYSQTRRALEKQFIKEGKSLSDPAVREKLREVGKPMGKEVRELFEKRVKLTELIPEPVRQKNKLNIPDVSVKVKGGRVRQIGKGVAGIAATMAAMYGASELISWAVGENEKFAVDDYYENGKTEGPNPKLPESAQENKEIMEVTANYFTSVDQEYNEIFDEFSPKNIEKMSEQQLKLKVSESVEKHADLIKEVKKFIQINRGSIEKFYREHPNAQGERDIGNILTLGYEKNELYLRHADSSSFKSEIWKQVDYIKANLADLLAGKEPGTWNQVSDQASYMIPGYGTYRDASDAYKNWERGNYTDAAWSTLWAGVGGISDALLIVPVAGWAAGAGLKVVRASRAAKAVKVASTAVKTSRLGGLSGRIAIGMMGADLLRPLFRPEKNETYKF